MPIFGNNKGAPGDDLVTDGRGYIIFNFLNLLATVGDLLWLYRAEPFAFWAAADKDEQKEG